MKYVGDAFLFIVLVAIIYITQYRKVKKSGIVKNFKKYMIDTIVKYFALVLILSIFLSGGCISNISEFRLICIRGFSIFALFVITDLLVYARLKKD